MSAWPNLVHFVTGAAVGAGVAAWGAVNPTSQLFGPAICCTPRANTLALTFDDGPNPAATPHILALLEKYNAKATFFLVGQFARACPELVREIAARGHCIGNHTEHHRNLTFLAPAAIEAELRECQESIEAAANVATRWMRPPYGFRGPQLWGALRRAGLQGVALWSLTCYDWKPQPASRLIDRLARVDARRRHRSDSGEVVLLHDGDHKRLGADRGHVVSALQHWLPRWRDSGVEFLTVDDIAKITSAAQ